MDYTNDQSYRDKSDRLGFQMKILLWLLAIVIVGSIICFIIGLLKAVVGSIVTVAGILLLIALVIFFVYERLKWKAHLAESEHQNRQLEARLNSRKQISGGE